MFIGSGPGIRSNRSTNWANTTAKCYISKMVAQMVAFIGRFIRKFVLPFC